MGNAGFDNSKPGSSSIQFGTAEYVGAPGADHCQFCQQPIAGSYYRLQGAIMSRLRRAGARTSKEQPCQLHARPCYTVSAQPLLDLFFMQPLKLRLVLIIGYVSLAVGWMVGKAMMKGSAATAVAATRSPQPCLPMRRYPRRRFQSGFITRASISHMPPQQQQLADEQRSLEQEPDAPKHWSPPNLWLTLARLSCS